MKFLGIGLPQAIGISFFVMIIIIMTKTVSSKYPTKIDPIIQTI